MDAVCDMMGVSAQVFRQLCIMLLYMLAGYTLYKKKILDEAGSKELATMLVKLIIPAVIVNSFCSEYTPEKAQKIAVSALGAALLLCVSILIARLIFLHKPIEQFSATFSNPGFIGLPLIQSMLGEDAAVLVVAFIAMLNILQASYGVGILREKQDKIEWKPLLLNPIVLGSVGGAALFASGLGAHIPDVVQTTLRGISALNSPLAMIVLGTYLAKENVCNLVKTPMVYVVCIIRQILIPIGSILLLYLFPADFNLKQVLLIAAACPVGANVAVYAQLYDKDYAYAGKIVVLSTLLAVLTMPIMIAAGSALL